MTRRKLKNPEDQARSISVAFDPKTIRELNDLCFEKGVSRSSFVQKLVVTSLDRRKKAKVRFSKSKQAKS